jgi:DNA-binding response OmpR family regulator
MNTNKRTLLWGSPLVALVAEKDTISRATLTAVLSCDGYRVFQAENLSAAISCIDRINDLAVLFADLNMPRWESLVQYARNMAPDVFVIAMAETDPGSKIPGLVRLGLQICLQKPILYNELRRNLRATIERQCAA